MSTAHYGISKTWAPLSTSAFQQEIKFQMHCNTASTRPLRVVRILEADHVPANVGRMMISGRMADVCAELDRLAERETAIH